MKGVARLEREMGEVKERLDRGEAEINRSEGVVSASGIQLGEMGKCGFIQSMKGTIPTAIEQLQTKVWLLRGQAASFYACAMVVTVPSQVI
ncbi:MULTISPECIES: hypothetical protein [Geobacillus]|jgi:hypothetical protein|uniref:hypothetical protein n=1 Tax=Geobacillus TaxID=129337 RepID=UPI0009BF55A8|nr:MULTISPECIES: hypothetical protein [Geobacillus]MEC5187896.1 hypothetical protein [Geobacillus thermodenitrificans]MED0663131.1 hypothetical protein [Geobacillus thermodenitrificans]MED3905219.1 hypothetical protein [Geobacillus thermodenitrificans]OQP09142.1 hypothetical protein B1691_12145 [Geobacillus sp. 47C-IIb]PJW19875.1 hypothetical protein CV632_13875 [Geobacillus thermodenitrificans]